MQPTVSVIIPVYNSALYLRQCIHSVLKQTYTTLQIILVDDGSADESPSICDSLAQKDSRIHVVHKKNGGVSSARNCGIAESTGEYVSFLDSDDTIEPNAVEKAVTVAEKQAADIVIWGFFADFMDSNNDVKYSIQHVVNEQIIVKGKSGPVVVNSELLGLMGYVWNKLYRRQMIMECAKPFDIETSLFEDVLFNAPLLICAKTVVYMDMCLTHYIQRDKLSLGRKYNECFFDLRLRVCEEYVKVLISWGMREEDMARVIMHQKFYALVSAVRNIRSASQFSNAEKRKKIKELSSMPIAQQILRQNAGISLKKAGFIVALKLGFL